MDVVHPWQDRLSEYLDGELDEAERSALRRTRGVRRVP